MKNILIAISLVLIVQSCVSTKTILPETKGFESISKESYILLDEKREECFNMRFWLLFIPFGGKNNQVRESKCYQRMIKNNKADGVLAQKYTHNKVSLTLLAISFQSFNTTFTGKPYILKTDTIKK